MMKKSIPDVDVGVIGGSGFYNLKTLNNERYVEIQTPFGTPSEKFLVGDIDGRSVAFLSRHGLGHRFSPSNVNYRANLYGMKLLNAGRIISVNAVGSLKEEIEPTSLVIPDQFIDFTRNRNSTYFDDGLVAHVSMADPVCPALSKAALEASNVVGLDTHPAGTYLNIEGPQFSSRAESELYRRFQCSVIGMTQAIEAKLARELEMCFVSLSFVTDYDCWHLGSDSVSVELIVENLQKNAENANRLISLLVNNIEMTADACSCQSSLQNAFITDPDQIPAGAREKLAPVIGKYIPLK